MAIRTIELLSNTVEIKLTTRIADKYTRCVKVNSNTIQNTRSASDVSLRAYQISAGRNSRLTRLNIMEDDKVSRLRSIREGRIDWVEQALAEKSARILSMDSLLGARAIRGLYSAIRGLGIGVIFHPNGATLKC